MCFCQVVVDDLSQNLFVEFLFFKNMAVVMTVEVVTDFITIFTGDLFKIAWQNSDFVSKVSIPQKKLAMVLSKIHVSNPGPLALLFPFPSMFSTFQYNLFAYFICR